MTVVQLAGEPRDREPWVPAWRVAEHFDVKPGTVLDWFEAGRIPGTRLGRKGGRVRFRIGDVERALAGEPGSVCDDRRRCFG